MKRRCKKDDSSKFKADDDHDHGLIILSCSVVSYFLTSTRNSVPSTKGNKMHARCYISGHELEDWCTLRKEYRNMHTGKLRMSGMPKTKKKFKVSVVISESQKLE